MKNKKKENMKKIDAENLLEVFEDKFREKYGIDLGDFLGEKGGVKKGIEIPVSIFREKIGASESLCRYLKDYKKLRFSEIAKLINRDQRTVAINYNHSIKKKSKIKISETGILIPISIFAERKLSVLEAVVNYLKNKNYRNFEIAKLLDKDPRNISTLYSRVKKKNN